MPWSVICGRSLLAALHCPIKSDTWQKSCQADSKWATGPRDPWPSRMHLFLSRIVCFQFAILCSEVQWWIFSWTGWHKTSPGKLKDLSLSAHLLRKNRSLSIRYLLWASPLHSTQTPAPQFFIFMHWSYISFSISSVLVLCCEALVGSVHPEIWPVVLGWPFAYISVLHCPCCSFCQMDLAIIKFVHKLTYLIHYMC